MRATTCNVTETGASNSLEFTFLFRVLARAIGFDFYSGGFQCCVDSIPSGPSCSPFYSVNVYPVSLDVCSL